MGYLSGPSPVASVIESGGSRTKLASYIRMYEQSGWIPTFPCVFGDAHCMNGNHAAGVSLRMP